MKKIFKVLATKIRWICAIALVAVIGFSFATCSDGKDNKDLHGWDVFRDESSTATETHSVDADGVCKVTIGGTPEKQDVDGVWNAWKISADYAYTVNAGKRYMYKFEAWTQSGTRNLHVQYYNDNDEFVYLGDDFPITTTRKTYTLEGQALPKGGSKKVQFLLADQLGTVYIKMIEIKEYENIWVQVWKDESSTATETHSFAADGVCTVTVGGTPDPSAWKISADYAYTVNAGKRYMYKFEAWTQSGTRSMHVQYYSDDENDYYLGDDISITTTRKTYTLEGQSLPKGGNQKVFFQLADQIGTVYIKMLEIKSIN